MAAVAQQEEAAVEEEKSSKPSMVTVTTPATVNGRRTSTRRAARAPVSETASRRVTRQSTKKMMADSIVVEDVVENITVKKGGKSRNVTKMGSLDQDGEGIETNDISETGFSLVGEMEEMKSSEMKEVEESSESIDSIPREVEEEEKSSDLLETVTSESFEMTEESLDSIPKGENQEVEEEEKLNLVLTGVDLQPNQATEAETMESGDDSSITSITDDVSKDLTITEAVAKSGSGDYDVSNDLTGEVEEESAVEYGDDSSITGLADPIQEETKVSESDLTITEVIRSPVAKSGDVVTLTGGDCDDVSSDLTGEVQEESAVESGDDRSETKVSESDLTITEAIRSPIEKPGDEVVTLTGGDCDVSEDLTGDLDEVTAVESCITDATKVSGSESDLVQEAPVEKSGEVVSIAGEISPESDAILDSASSDPSRFSFKEETEVSESDHLEVVVEESGGAPAKVGGGDPVAPSRDVGFYSDEGGDQNKENEGATGLTVLTGGGEAKVTGEAEKPNLNGLSVRKLKAMLREKLETKRTALQVLNDNNNVV